MGKKQKNNSAYNGAPTDKKETVYKNDTNDEYVYENGQYESAHGGNGCRYGTNRLEYGIAGKKNADQRHRLNSERELMKYPNELSQLTDRMASDSWQG